MTKRHKPSHCQVINLVITRVGHGALTTSNGQDWRNTQWFHDRSDQKIRTVPYIIWNYCFPTSNHINTTSFSPNEIFFVSLLSSGKAEEAEKNPLPSPLSFVFDHNLRDQAAASDCGHERGSRADHPSKVQIFQHFDPLLYAAAR